ncbi:hypothetical protein SLS58_009142 [Diplodia intermedia]|uniref:Uncharacterized protein n=1 Tax=Diplodia intermedia TaxID=856260 RepID=A0ABR3TDU6_9PEZI
MDKWREIWIILFPEDGQENIPPPNAEDLSMYQRQDLIDRLQASVFASFKDWEHYLVQQAEAGFIPAADGDLDISWLVTPLRSKLTEVFNSFRESHLYMSVSTANAEERAGMAAYPIEGQPAYPHEPDNSHSQASFAGGEPLSQSSEQSQTVSLANVQMQNVHGQYVPVGMQYHPQSLHGDLSGVFHPWYPHEAGPYHDQLDSSRYDNNE